MPNSSELSSIIDCVLSRDYPTALAGIHALMKSSDELFRDPRLWTRLVNCHDWFETLEEHEQYLQYISSMLHSVAEHIESIGDRNLAARLATGIIDNVQFRQAAHSNGDPRFLMRARARLFLAALSVSRIDREFAFPKRIAGSSIRLGILFKHLVQDPETASVLPFFESARMHGIKVFLFVGSDRAESKFLEYVSKHCDEIIRLPTALNQAVQRIRGKDLDILLFGNDITAKPSAFSYLSFFRMARLQATCVTSLMTTASPAIDIYFGCRYYSRAGFDVHFDEQIVQLPDPGFAFSFPFRTTHSEMPPPSEVLKLAPGTLLFCSGANQTKLHKGVITVWAKILHRCPNSALLLYPFPPHYGGARDDVIQRVLSHFSEFGIAPRRIVVAPTIPSRDLVVSLLRAVDVGLDSFPYTGVTSVVDAIQACLPTVTLKGHSLRSSQGAAIMASAGLNGLIAENVDEYIDIAVRLGLDSQVRRAIKFRIDNYVNNSVGGFLKPKSFSDAAANAFKELHRHLILRR